MPATLVDKLLLVPALTWVIARTLLSIPGSLARGQDGAPTALEHITSTGFRSLFYYLSAAQLQVIMPPFATTYEKWGKKTGHPIDIVGIPNTTIKGFWIGNKESATYKLVYYHGGGFVMPGLDVHVEMLFRWVEWSKNSLAIFCPAYTLAPGQTYPTQLGQSVEGLRYVLSQPGQSPDKVLLGGDSAGGQLVLAVLSHISGHEHPRKDLVKPLKVSGKLYGAIVIAPWTSSDTVEFPSATQFIGRDIIGPTEASKWSTDYKGSAADDEYIVPELAEPAWWKDTKVSSLLAVSGEQEVLRDAIQSWANKFAKGASGVDFKHVVGKSEVHDAPLTPKPANELDGKEEVCQEAAIRAWIKARLT